MNKPILANEEFKIEDSIDLDSTQKLYTYGKWITNVEIVLNRNIVDVKSAAEIGELPEKLHPFLEEYFDEEKISKVLEYNNLVTFGDVSYDGCRLATNHSGTIKELISSKYADEIEFFDCFYYAPENCFYIFYPLDEEDMEMFMGVVMKIKESHKKEIGILQELEKKLQKILNNYYKQSRQKAL